jgi:hypothetical protein
MPSPPSGMSDLRRAGANQELWHEIGSHVYFVLREAGAELGSRLLEV